MAADDVSPLSSIHVSEVEALGGQWALVAWLPDSIP